MAKGNMLLGTLRGSIGDVTFTRTGGKQVSKAKATNVKNPRTSKQTYQRMFMATVVKAQSAMKNIVDHSFEQVAHGSKSLQYFTKRNIALLRNKVHFDAASQDWVGPGMCFVTPNWPSMTFNKYRMSEGSLPQLTDMAPFNPSLTAEMSAYDVNLLMPFYINFSNANWLDYSVPEDFADAWNSIMNQFGVKVGDYLSMVLITAKTNDMQGAGVIYPNYFHYFRFKVIQVNATERDNPDNKYSFMYPVLPNVDGDNVYLPNSIDIILTTSSHELRQYGLFAEYTEGQEVKVMPYISLIDVTGHPANWLNLNANFVGVDHEFKSPFTAGDDVILAGTWIHSRPTGSKLLVSTSDMELFDNTGDIYDYNLGIDEAFDEWNAKTKQIGDNSLILEGGQHGTI